MPSDSEPAAADATDETVVVDKSPTSQATTTTVVPTSRARVRECMHGVLVQGEL